MRKLLSLIFALLAALFCLAGTVSASASEETQIQQSLLSNVPYLESISFSNAEIDGGFSKDTTFFSITLNDPSVSPTLKSYSVSGEAKLFVTYSYDENNRQTGIIVTLAFESGSVIYTFNYSNVQQYKITGNANLADLICEYGEVQPAINATDTSYKLYIPSDVTVLDITPVTEDINAKCAPLSIEINEKQEPLLGFTVVASDGSTKYYKFKVKRVSKTVEEIKAEMESPDFKSFADGERFYQKPLFIIVLCAAAGGFLIIVLLAAITKRITINPYDKDEKDFYAHRE